MTDYKYDKIVNPTNGDKLKIDSQKGKTIIKKYENIIKTKKITQSKDLKAKNSTKNDIKLINLESTKNEETIPTNNSNPINKKIDVNDLDLLADPQKKKKRNKRATSGTSVSAQKKHKKENDKYIETSINNVKDDNPYKLDDEISYVASVSTINSSLIDNLSAGGSNDNDVSQHLDWNKKIKNNDKDIETLSILTKKSVDDIKSVDNIKSVDDIKSINDISVKSKISENYNLSEIIKRTDLLENEVNTIKRLLKNLSENL